MKKDSCINDNLSVPRGTEVYGLVYSKFKIIKGILIEIAKAYYHNDEYIARIYIPSTNKIEELNTRCVYTKLEDVYAHMRHRISYDNKIYLKNLEEAQNNYTKFIHSIPEEYKYLINENNK